MNDLDTRVETILADLQFERAVEAPDAVRKVLRRHLQEIQEQYNNAIQIYRNSLDYWEGRTGQKTNSFKI